MILRAHSYQGGSPPDVLICIARRLLALFGDLFAAAFRWLTRAGATGGWPASVSELHSQHACITRRGFFETKPRPFSPAPPLSLLTAYLGNNT